MPDAAPTTTGPAERASQLRAEIDAHNYRYYVEANPTVSDREFDSLLEELARLERDHPELVTPDSPTQRVGGQPIEGFVQVRHAVPMLSIENSYNADDLRKFDADLRKFSGREVIRYSVELKIDGVSMSVTYADGQLTLGATRGRGDVGDDVTHNVRTVNGVPLKLRAPDGSAPPKRLEVRGEVYMTRAELARLNAALVAAGDEPYKNTRNLTAGTLKLLDPRLAAKRKLCFFAYGSGAAEGISFANQAELFEKLRAFGLPVNPHNASLDGIDAVIAHCESWGEKRRELPYDTDGIVIKADDFALRQQLGATSKVPRWAKAFKFEAEQGQSRLGGVEFSVGKFGELTPVALFDPPMQLGGTTVGRASMHNASWVEEIGIRIGDAVVVEKKGEIIPQVVAVVAEARTGAETPVVWPTACPKCGAPVEREESAISYGWYCTDTGRCPAQLTKRVLSYGRRDRMEIDGLGEEVAKQLIESELVKTLPDLYRMTERQLLGLEGFAKTKAKNLLAGVEASKSRGLSRWLAALSIYSVGGSIAALLVNDFATIDALLAASVEEIARVKGIGPKRAEAVYQYFHSPEGEKLVAEFKELGLDLTHTAVARTGLLPLSGKTVVVTGTLLKYDRLGIEAKIKSLGGKPTGSISAKTNYLVAGENAGSKLAKAKELGVAVLTEDEFERLANGEAAVAAVDEGT